ncbi:MAG: ABC transporter ATP-binding protein [Firmicutes bacterium]|nr:ABC transporter ATP-binding protein [Bacillota bacterium]
MLEVKDLSITFLDDGAKAVDSISFSMAPGERLGLVGESGSGKTVTALAIAGLLDRGRVRTEGQILFQGLDILSCKESELLKIRGKDVGMVFQEPMTSLDPLMRVGPQIEESLRVHSKLTARQRKALALQVMQHVDLPDPETTYRKYPHQMSGGQRQRAMIAAAFISRPKLLICDEPTTALDVTVQAQILNLLLRINEQSDVGLLFISHDLSVVRRLCQRVAVMYKGRIVETGPAEQVFSDPQHEYTQRLVAAIPSRGKGRRQ